MELAHAHARQEQLETALRTMQHERSESASREAVELGAALAQATWRQNRSEEAAVKADAERRRALDDLYAAQQHVSQLQARIDSQVSEREELHTQFEILSARVAELTAILDEERSNHKAEIIRVNNASSHAVGEATQRALTIHTEFSENKKLLERQRVACVEAEEACRAQREAANEANERAASLEETLEEERSRFERESSLAESNHLAEQEQSAHELQRATTELHALQEETRRCAAGTRRR